MWSDPLGKRGRSIAHYRTVLEREPADWSALCFVLRHLQSAGRDAEALDTAERALEAEPDHFLALQTAACLAVKLGRYQDAKDYVERSVAAVPEIHPDSVPSRAFDGLMSLVWRAGRIVRGARVLAGPPTPPSWGAACELEEWKVWARRYLAWYASVSEEPEEDGPAIEQGDATAEACKEDGQ
jgi:tetratricopeptide (TPR) repeat protein